MVQITGDENALQIVQYTNEWAPDFARLNYEWIGRYFSVEQHDRDILDEPDRWVIAAGGMIFVALVDHQAAGTVALIPTDLKTLELTKMAVSPSFQGRGIGDALIMRCIEHAGLVGVSIIFLESNTRLTPAINLYRKHGFVETPLDPDSHYARVNIRMEKRIV